MGMVQGAAALLGCGCLSLPCTPGTGADSVAQEWRKVTGVASPWQGASDDNLALRSLPFLTNTVLMDAILVKFLVCVE